MRTCRDRTLASAAMAGSPVRIDRSDGGIFHEVSDAKCGETFSLSRPEGMTETSNPLKFQLFVADQLTFAARDISTADFHVATRMCLHRNRP